MRAATVAFLLLLLPAASFAAGDHGFQLETSGLISQPVGHYASGERAPELFGIGTSARLKALFATNRMVSIGMSAAYLKNWGEFDVAADLDQPTLGAVSGTRTLATIPILAIAQVRTDTHDWLSWYGEYGVGLSTFQLRYTELSDGSGPRSAFQQAVTFQLGFGMVQALNKDWELVAGFDYQQSVTGAGDVFSNGDDPRYALYSIGLRYPRW